MKIQDCNDLKSTRRGELTLVSNFRTVRSDATVPPYSVWSPAIVQKALLLSKGPSKIFILKALSHDGLARGV